MVTSLDKNTALVLIDLQRGIIAFPVVHPIAGVLANSAKLVAAFRKANLPIVIVNVNPGTAKWTTARKDAPQGNFTPPANWLEIADEIKTEPTDVFITKHTWSAFPETGLDEQLKKLGVTGIVIGGVSTSIGVEGTARDASVLGYNITFASDAMTDMVASAHENSQNTIFPRIGEVDVTDKIIEILS
jgi:nicotinamidase-related amidase